MITKKPHPKQNEASKTTNHCILTNKRIDSHRKEHRDTRI